MLLPDGRRKGTCSLWLKRSEPCNWILLSLIGLALASAALSVLLYIEPCGRRRHEIINKTITSGRGSPRPRAGDKKTTYDRHNTTTVMNLTSYENITVLENAGRGAEISTRLDAVDQSRRCVPRRTPSQVTVFETVIELENVTTTQNVSVLVNETVKYNATYNVTYDVLRNVTFDVVYNQSYNITYNTRRRGVEFRHAVDARKATPRRRTINVTEYVNVTKEVTTTYNISSHQPVDVVLALDASRSVKDADFVAENRAGRELLRGLRDSLTGDLHAGVAVWAVDGVSRRDLTSIANATEIDEMEDVARLPYCAAVPPPYSADAETYSNHFCVGDPPAVQDEDHAYDLRHDASQVWGLTMRRRSTIDKLLTRAKHLRKKKHVGGPLSPLRTASPKNNEEPRRRSAPLLARDADTDWSSGVAAVYDGDDWQESVADFVISLVCCRFCRKTSKEEATTTYTSRGVRAAAAVAASVLLCPSQFCLNISLRRDPAAARRFLALEQTIVEKAEAHLKRSPSPLRLGKVTSTSPKKQTSVSIR